MHCFCSSFLSFSQTFLKDTKHIPAEEFLFSTLMAFQAQLQHHDGKGGLVRLLHLLILLFYYFY
jgi:hypothetical protein